MASPNGIEGILNYDTIHCQQFPKDDELTLLLGRPWGPCLGS